MKFLVASGLRPLLLALVLSGALTGAAAAAGVVGGLTPVAHAQGDGRGGRPHGVDLDVLYIERTPKYERYAVEYRDGRPSLRHGSETAQRWPQTGEIVTFAAHVMNKGTERSAGFAVTWYIDETPVQTETAPPLWPNEEHVFTYRWPWAHSVVGERLLDTHRVRVVVDAHEEIVETFETNNVLEDRTDALGLWLLLTPEVYAVLDNQPVAGQAFSAEDWLQRHVTALNVALAEAVYPATPGGAAVQVRIDKIQVAWSRPADDVGYDGVWFVDSDYRATSDHYRAVDDIDWGMLHEWGHQLGLVDTYRYHVAAQTVDVVRADGRPWLESYDMPGSGWMETAEAVIDEYSAAALNAGQGYRRGYFGEYQYDLPPEIILEVRDRQGCRMEGAMVAFYQRNPRTGGSEKEEDRRIDDTPEFTGATDAAGRFVLPNRPAGDTVATATGFTLRANPFGAIDLVGSGNIGVIKLQKGGQERFTWLNLAALNLQYWQAGKPHTLVAPLTWEGEGNAGTCPVGGTEGGNNSTIYLPLALR
jgi:hypothetical protein